MTSIAPPKAALHRAESLSRYYTLWSSFSVCSIDEAARQPLESRVVQHHDALSRELSALRRMACLCHRRRTVFSPVTPPQPPLPPSAPSLLLRAAHPPSAVASPTIRRRRRPSPPTTTQSAAPMSPSKILPSPPYHLPHRSFAVVGFPRAAVLDYPPPSSLLWRAGARRLVDLQPCRSDAA